MANQIVLRFNRMLLKNSRVGLYVGLMFGSQALLATQNDIAAQVTQKHLFPEPLVWVGNEPPADSAELLADIGLFETGGVNAGLEKLEEFLKAHPQSAWSPSLNVNLAEYYREHGYYSQALKCWKAAWDATNDKQDAASQKIAARTIAGWTRLLASLGEKDQVTALFAELDSRQFPLGIYATKINETREAVGVMKYQPGVSYRCGSFALGHMALVMGLDKEDMRRFFTVASPDGGFHISELLKLAETNGLAVEAVRRPEGAALVVPSVVHWKLNHFAAITGKQGELYEVVDPTFERPQLMDARAIEAEASGEYILPKDKVPASWQKLTVAECASIYGKGFASGMEDDDDFGPPSDCPPSDDDSDDSGCDPPSSNDGTGGGGGGSPPNPPDPPQCPDCGMPQWSVSEPYIALWLKDAPLLYRQSSGKWMKLEMSYKSTSKDAQSTYMGGFGDKWTCNWLGMLKPAGTSFTDVRAGGGHESFLATGILSYKTARRFIYNAVGGIISPSIMMPSRAFNYYGITNIDLLMNTRYLLSSRFDRYGRMLHKFNYQTVGNLVRMTNMLDMDGRTNTLYYGNTTFSNLITAVTDPYGHTAYFNYNANGLLTNIIDVAGMSTTFKYDGDENITNMTTLYGTTGFKYFSSPLTNSEGVFIRRALQVTEATGDKQLYQYIDAGPYALNSYHWNRAQYANLSTTDPWSLTDEDYKYANLNNWMPGDSTSYPPNVSDNLQYHQDPYDDTLGYRPNYTVYHYQGQYYGSISYGNFALKRVTEIDDYSGKVIEIGRNDLGRPTNTVYYNTTSGLSGSYTNFYDASGTILQRELGPSGELTRGYGYDPVKTNLLVAVTNAVGDVIRYTHDANSKVTSITFPGGLIRTNIYYTSGPNQGFLQAQIDIGLRTNYFVYSQGNLAVQTNELGLVTTNLYDNLSRLVSAAYPDGSTVSNIYNKLDVVATKDRLNQWTYYNYNSVRQLMGVTNVNSQVTTYDYCGCGSPDQVIHWNGATPVVTTLSYNLAGMLTNILYPDSYQLKYQYDDHGRVYKVTDGAGNQLQINYQMYGLKSLLSTVTLGTEILTETYDEYGRLTNHIDGESIVTVQSYDFLDRLKTRQMTDYGNSINTGTETFAYNALGVTNYYDQLNRLTTYVRDNGGRMLYQTNANLEVQKFTYNPADELLTLTDGASQTTTWAYDSFGRVTNKVDALGTNILRYQYDANDRLTNRWSAAKANTTYKYDPIGNLTNVLYPTSSNLVFRYDYLNRLTNMVDGTGSTAFGWTLGDQLASEDGPWAYDAINYTYNAGHQRSSLSLIQPNASPWVQTYTYDFEMRLEHVFSLAGDFEYYYQNFRTQKPALRRFANNTCDVYLSRDGLQRLTETRLFTPQWQTHPPGPGIPALDLQYGYDAASQRTQQVFTTGNVMNYTYDNIGQLKTAKGLESDGTTARLQEQFGYLYDAAWNLNRRTNNAFIQAFGVNKVNELTNATRSGTFTVAGDSTAYKDPYGYYGVTNVVVSGTGLSSGSAELYLDGSWARTNATLANGVNAYTATAYDAYGRQDTASESVNLPATSAYTYDLNGNLLSDGTRNFAYNDENQLIIAWVSGVWSNNFVYDGFLRKRIERNYNWNGSAWIKTSEIRYVYDGNLVIQERDANNLPLVTYTRGNDLSDTLQGAGGIGGLLARTDNGQQIGGNATAHAYYFNDANGNVVGLVSTNGMLVAQYTYDPFGNVLTTSGPLASANRYRFSSKEWNDNTGLYYYGYRFYDPNLQRWLNRDPIDEDGGINLYRFTENNSIGFADPYGLQCPIGTFVSAQTPAIPRPILEQAIELNRPWSRVRLPDGREVDLKGDPHPDTSGNPIPTPHVHEPKPAHPAPYDKLFPTGNQAIPRPATLGDIMDSIIELKGSLGGTGCSNCQQNSPSLTYPKGMGPGTDTKSESPPPKMVPVIPSNQWSKYCPMA